MSTVDRLRDRGWRAINGLGGRVGKAARTINDTLGRPLATADELADRRTFQARHGANASATSSAAQDGHEPAPVFVYTLDDKRKGDIPRIKQILDDAEVPYKVMPLDADPAALAAVRRDSGGKKPPLVFIAGESIGGRLELINLGRDGLRKRVFG